MRGGAARRPLISRAGKSGSGCRGGGGARSGRLWRLGVNVSLQGRTSVWDPTRLTPAERWRRPAVTHPRPYFATSPGM